MKLEEHCIHGRDMVEDFHLSLEAIRLAKRSAWGANTEMQVLAVGIQWGMDEANKNIAKLEAENARYREALTKISTPDTVVFDGLMAYSYKMIAREALKGGE